MPSLLPMPAGVGLPLAGTQCSGECGEGGSETVQKDYDSVLLTSLGQYQGYLFLLKHPTFRISCPHSETHKYADEVFMVWVLSLQDEQFFSFPLILAR